MCHMSTHLVISLNYEGIIWESIYVSGVRMNSSRRDVVNALRVVVFAMFATIRTNVRIVSLL